MFNLFQTWEKPPSLNQAILIKLLRTKVRVHFFFTAFIEKKYFLEIANQEQEQMAHELKHSKETIPQKSSVHETRIKIEKHQQHSRSDLYPDVVTYKMERSDLEDGIAETASGAVLSLTLGLILTCIMALLIACRLRVRRRMRKSGKSYAHDADYLVNGMYL